MVKVVIERRCKPGEEKRLEGLLKDLRASCMRQSTYVSGETLIDINDPTHYMVVGTWTRLGGWQGWKECQERQELLQMVSACIEQEPVIHVYAAAGNGLGGFEMDEHFVSMISTD